MAEKICHFKSTKSTSAKKITPKEGVHPLVEFTSTSNRYGEDNSAGGSKSSYKERMTEEEMGRHQRKDRTGILCEQRDK